MHAIGNLANGKAVEPDSLSALVTKIDHPEIVFVTFQCNPSCSMEEGRIRLQQSRNGCHYQTAVQEEGPLRVQHLQPPTHLPRSERRQRSFQDSCKPSQWPLWNCGDTKLFSHSGRCCQSKRRAHTRYESRGLNSHRGLVFKCTVESPTTNQTRSSRLRFARLISRWWGLGFRNVRVGLYVNSTIDTTLAPNFTPWFSLADHRFQLRSATSRLSCGLTF